MTQATSAADLWSELEEIKRTLTTVSTEKNISEVLMLTILKDFCDRQLVTVIDQGK